ncbi:MAG: hypothetical protein K2Q21_10705 [Chitinophagaceae bacterium]|nr:hypothetical protein [Chitinophagaceae bacterium]
MKIKWSLLVFIFSLTILTSYGQRKITKYCEVRLSFSRIKGGYNITSIDYGKQQNVKTFSDSTVENKLEKVKDYTTQVGILNYMSNIDWSLVSIIPITSNWGTVGIELFFKKIFNDED